MKTDGMMIEASSPLIETSGPRRLSATITAAAPATWAFFTLTVKLQVPRSTSAIRPATSPGLVSVPQPSSGESCDDRCREARRRRWRPELRGRAGHLAGQGRGGVDAQPRPDHAVVGAGGHGQRVVGARRAAHDRVEVTVVARRDHHHRAERDERVDGALAGRIGAAVGRAQGQVDDVEPVGEVAISVGIAGPLETGDGLGGAAAAAEDPDRVELCLGCHPGPDQEAPRIEPRLPRPCEVWPPEVTP